MLNVDPFPFPLSAFCFQVSGFRFHPSLGRAAGFLFDARFICNRALKPYSKGMETTAYRYLVNLPGVCNGHAIIANTRIGVHDVMGLILNGVSIEDVRRTFPDLTKAQIYECLAYYEDHRTEIEALVAEQMIETL